MVPPATTSRPGVAGLPAARRVEDGPVEHESAPLVVSDDSRLAVTPVSVVAEERQGCDGHQSAFSNGSSTTERLASQVGTGRSFERRNSGLKSLEA